MSPPADADPPQRPIDAVRAMLTDLLGGPDASIAFRREQAAGWAANQPPPPAGLRIAPDTLAGVPVERLEPESVAPLGLVLHLHGGGYVMGDPGGSRAFTTALALRAGASVVSVDYRLAPEHPFPAAVDDTTAVYRVLLDAGADPARVALAGESAGGGLVLATLLALRDAGLPQPACAILLSPWTDLACTGASYASRAGRDPLLTREILLEMAQAYLNGATTDHPLASPAGADLRGLPPLLVQVGDEEVLLDDAVSLAARARACDVDVQLEVWPEMIHVWQMFAGLLPEADEALDRVATFLRARWI